MKNPWDPTDEEIREWAFEANALCPEDWDLWITGIGKDELLLELAGDDACPKREFFLRCLYLLVGDAVRTERRQIDRALLDKLFALAEASQNAPLQKWVSRSRHLIEHPDEFNYEKWCHGGLVREDRG